MADRLCSEDAVTRCEREQLREAMAEDGAAFYDKFVVDGLGVEEMAAAGDAGDNAEEKEIVIEGLEEVTHDDDAVEEVVEELQEEALPEVAVAEDTPVRYLKKTFYHFIR